MLELYFMILFVVVAFVALLATAFSGREWPNDRIDWL